MKIKFLFVLIIVPFVLSGTKIFAADAATDPNHISINLEKILGKPIDPDEVQIKLSQEAESLLQAAEFRIGMEDFLNTLEIIEHLLNILTPKHKPSHVQRMMAILEISCLHITKLRESEIRNFFTIVMKLNSILKERTFLGEACWSVQNRLFNLCRKYPPK